MFADKLPSCPTLLSLGRVVRKSRWFLLWIRQEVTTNYHPAAGWEPVPQPRHLITVKGKPVPCPCSLKPLLNLLGKPALLFSESVMTGWANLLYPLGAYICWHLCSYTWTRYCGDGRGPILPLQCPQQYWLWFHSQLKGNTNNETSR